MNITACQHPRLREALQFPPHGCRREPQVLPTHTQPTRRSPGAYLFKAVNALFLAVSAVGKPLEAFTRGTYAFEPVTVDLGV